jgi:integrase
VSGVALLAVGDRKLGLQRRVLLAQSLVLGAHRLKPLAQRRLAGPLTRRHPIRRGRRAVVERLDPGAQLGLGVEPLARHPGALTTLVRRAMVATLGCAGLRNTELCDLDWPDLVFAHRKIRVADAKTPAGVREVAMTPRLLEELLAYRSTLGDVAHDDPAFPTLRGTRRNKDNLNARVMKPALTRANELRAERGLPALPPGVTVHTLRRTYVSLMLAAGADVRWVQSQVGHEDAKMTLDVYTQVLQRKDRELYTEAFDRLMADAIPSAAAVRMAAHPDRGLAGMPPDRTGIAPEIAPERR